MAVATWNLSSDGAGEGSAGHWGAEGKGRLNCVCTGSRLTTRADKPDRTDRSTAGDLLSVSIKALINQRPRLEVTLELTSRGAADGSCVHS